MTTPDPVGTVRIVPGAPANLESLDTGVTVEFEAGSVEFTSVVTYRPGSAWDIPDLPLGFVAAPRAFELSMTWDETSDETSAVTESPGRPGFLLKSALLTEWHYSVTRLLQPG